MTCLLSPESEFEGGDLELMAEGKVAKNKTRTRSILFASFIRHRVKTCNTWQQKIFSYVVWRHTI